MTKHITRRKFIQAAGLTGAAMAVSGCTINLQRSEKLVPYVTPPEEALPGENIWYASACRQCPAGCGILVRVSNGRAHKIEGNPLHPLNKGKLCARGQAGLQVLYNPDRLRTAVSQSPRGSRTFATVAWDAALQQVADRVKAARKGAVAFYGTFGADSLAAIVSPFLKALGAGAPVFYDPLVAFEGRGALARVAGRYFGTQPTLPFFDLAESDVVFSFGANFAETWISPVAYGRGFGEMRGAALGKRGYLVQFEPRLSATGAVADEWVPILPGTEGLVALAIGAIMVELGLGKVKESPAAAMFKAVDVNGIAAASGVSVEKLHSLAEMFAKFAHPTAIPGGGLSGHTNAPAAMAAVLALNDLAGRAAQGGAFHLTPPTADPALVAAAPSSFADVQELIKKMQGGGVDVLFLAGNPLYDLPAAAGFAQALANVPLVVSFSSLVDESAAQADLILPDHSYLESWGYQVAAPAADRPSVSSQQPVVAPFFDTRATTDVFLDLANRLGGAVKQALPWPNTVAFMKDVTARLVGKNAPFAVKNADQVWAGWRQMGGWWPTEAAVTEPKGTAALGQRLDLQRPRFDGDSTAFPLYLYPYPSIALSDGRGATQPWLQEAPDPMTTAAWDTWVEINPKTAQKLGLKRNDVVKILTSNSLVLAVVYPYPGIHPNVIAVPLGQGHADSGRYAKNRGTNVISLLSVQTTPDGELAWGATRVRLEPLGRTRTLPVIESNIGVATANEEKHIPGW